MARLGRAQPFKPLSQGLLYEFLPHVFIGNASATISVAASRNATAARVASYIRALSDSISVGASRSSTATGGKLIVRAVAATISVAAGRAATVVGILNGFILNLWQKIAKPVTDLWVKKDKPTL